jgi:NADPH:quinone reductase-like Zn-dependent oxidoreductase
MKAIVCTGYGPPEVLRYQEVAKPIPKDNELLIRIYATTVTAGDCEIRSLKLGLLFRIAMRLWLGIRKPRGTTILGTEFAGEIEMAGKDVTLFKKGDKVFGSAGLSFGTNAEYICLPEKGELATKPVNMSYEEAAAVPFGGRDALHFLRKGNLQGGQKILINGAGGSIGTFAIQLAKYFGAEVTAVDSTEKLDMLSSIGADRVIDYTKEDFARRGEAYDVIFDIVGKSSYSDSLRSLKKNGFYLLANPPPSQMLRGIMTSIKSGKTVISSAADGTAEDLRFLRKLIEAGKIKPVIDKNFTLEQVAEAHRYVDTGAKQGNVTVSI